MVNLLLVKNDLQDLEIFKNSINDNTKLLIDRSLNDFLSSIDNNTQHIGFVYHYQGYPSIEYFNQIDISNYKYEPSEYRFIEKSFLDMLKQVKNINPNIIFDLLTCNVTDEYFIKELYRLTDEYGFVFRYSTNEKGYGGDWIQESHNISIKNIYFNNNIDLWEHVLNSSRNISHMASNFSDYFELSGTSTLLLKQNFTWSSTQMNTDYIILSGGEIFDGQGYTIDVSSSLTSNFSGLFFSTASSSNRSIIRNLRVNLFKFMNTGAGVIMRRDQASVLIENCNSSCDPNVMNEYCGGISGNGLGNQGSSIINNCYSTCIIRYGGGGICGSNAGRGSSFNGGNCTINNCYSTGEMVSANSGGIVGWFSGSDNGNITVNNCYYTNDVNIFSGGILGAYPGGDPASFNGTGRWTVTNCVCNTRLVAPLILASTFRATVLNNSLNVNDIFNNNSKIFNTLGWSNTIWIGLNNNYPRLINNFQIEPNENLSNNNFTNLNLSNKNLNGVNLSNTNLTNVNLENSNLIGAILLNANLSNVNLSNRDLSGINFTSTILTNTNLENSNLIGTILLNANLSNVNLSNRDLSGINFTNTNLTNANLLNSSLNNAILLNANLSNVDLSNRDLSGINFTSTNLSNVNLENSNLNNTILINTNLSNVNLSNRNFSGFNLSGTILNNSNLSNCNLSGTILTNSNLTNANLNNAITGPLLDDTNIVLSSNNFMFNKFIIGKNINVNIKNNAINTLIEVSNNQLIDISSVVLNTNLLGDNDIEKYTELIKIHNQLKVPFNKINLKNLNKDGYWINLNQQSIDIPNINNNEYLYLLNPTDTDISININNEFIANVKKTGSNYIINNITYNENNVVYIDNYKFTIGSFLIEPLYTLKEINSSINNQTIFVRYINDLSLNGSITNIPVTTMDASINYLLYSGFRGSIIKFNLSSDITNFNEEPLILDFDLPNITDTSKILKLYKIVNDELIIDNNYPVDVIYTNNKWRTYIPTLSNFIVIDNNAPNTILGGDPYIKSLKNNNVFLLPNSWNKVILYQSDKYQVIGYNDLIPSEKLINMKKIINNKIYNLTKEGTAIYNFNYLLKLEVLNIETNEKLILDTFNGTILENNNISIEEITTKNGLISVDKNFYFPKKNLKAFMINLDSGNYITIKIDNYWIELNNIKLYSNNVSKISGELIEHNILNNLIY